MANEKIVNIENLKAFRQANDQRYIDGQVVVGKSLSTKAVDNISEESGTTQETPFINQGTGTNNNTDETPTSPVGKQLEKQGNTVCVNQLLQNGNFANDSGWTVSSNASATYNSNIATFTAGNKYDSIRRSISLTDTTHKYLISCDIKLTTGTTQVNFGVGYNYILAGPSTTNTTSWQTLSTIVSGNSQYLNIRVADYRDSGFDAIQIKNMFVIDLTQWFNGDIPQDLLDHPEHWSWYQNYGDYIAYNTGTLVNSDGQYLECGQGRNVWDEVAEIGGLNAYGQNNNSQTDRIRSKNYIRVIPNRTYYIKSPNNVYIYGYDANKENGTLISDGYKNTTFNVPSNVHFIRFRLPATYGTTYNHDITISLWYDTGDGYSEYYPYVSPKTYDTGVEVLRKAGSVKDIKAPDGTITRRIYEHVFSNDDNWVWNNSANSYTLVLENYSDRNAIIQKGYRLVSTYAEVRDNDKTMYIGGTNSDTLYIHDSNYVDTAQLSAFKTYLNGSNIYYGLATPTTEQGTPFSENIEINDYGTMAWLDSNNALVEIPQGCKIFYPADYVLLMDDLNNYVDGDVSKLALKTDLSEYVKQVDLSSGITDNAGLTYDFKKAYKVGNVVSLTIRAKNETGSSISSGSTLFTLGSGAIPNVGLRFIVYANDTVGNIYASNDGNCNCSVALPNGSYIILCVSYAVS